VNPRLTTFLPQNIKQWLLKNPTSQMGVSVLIDADNWRFTLTYCTAMMLMLFPHARAVLTHYIKHSPPPRHVACRKWTQQAVAITCSAEAHSPALPLSNNWTNIYVWRELFCYSKFTVTLIYYTEGQYWPTRSGCKNVKKYGEDMHINKKNHRW